MKSIYRFNRRGLYGKIRNAVRKEIRREGDEIYARRMAHLKNFPEIYASVISAENETRQMIYGVGHQTN